MLLKTTNLFLLFFALSFILCAQQNSSHSKMLQTFDSIIGLENTKLYNGKRYYNIYKASENNHNFYSSPNFIKGDVYYNEAIFFNVNLKYDTYNDQLIFQPNGEKGFINIELIRDKVLKFKLNNHKFVHSKTIKENNNLVSGFLDIIYSTETITLYAKRKKSVTERIRSNKLVYLFSNEPDFYIAYNGVLSKISSSKTYRKLFPNLNSDIKKEVKENKSRFKDDDEGLYLFLTQWLDFKLNTISAN